MTLPSYGESDDIELQAVASDFRRDGIVHVAGVLSDEEVARYGAAVDKAVALRKKNDSRTFAEKTPYEQSFVQCQYLWEDFPEVRPLTFHQRIGRLAAMLIQGERVRLWHDQALYKEPGGRETEAHQDHPYWALTDEAFPDPVPWPEPGDERRQRSIRLGITPGEYRP